MNTVFIFLFLTLLAGDAAAQNVSAHRIRADTRFLSSDLLEGRGVGARGGQLATEYLATQFAIAGAKPAGDAGTYFQNVTLTGVTTKPSSSLTVEGASETATLAWIDDFVGATGTQEEHVGFDGDVLFVGHGITAPEFDWNDYGILDVAGKVLVMFTNEPPSNNEMFFGGRALTYYGRWTYKFEEAARRGAAAVIVIHTAETAGYGWDVVRNSWGRESMQVKAAAGHPALQFAGWVTRAVGERMLRLAGQTVDGLLAKADAHGLEPIRLGLRIKGNIVSVVRETTTRNVAAVVEGSDPKVRSEAVILSAHWDHLGIDPEAHGDGIYNGAVDNATGCAVLLEMARVWAALESKPARSALFLAFTAEESGLLGSQYYAKNPVLPVGKTAAAFNFDAYHPLGLPESIVLSGAERTSLWPVVQEIARRRQLNVEPDRWPEQGGYFRSDHFPFAQAGIPAFSIHAGGGYGGMTEAEVRTAMTEFSANHYHRPSDQFDESWNFSGLAEIAEFGLLLGWTVADMTELPD